MRQGRPDVRGRFIQIEPRLSVTAASADRWVPIRPGTEGLLAIGIGQVILKEGWSPLPTSERRPFEKIFNAVDFDWIASETEVAKEGILRLARGFSRADAPLAIGGGIASAQTNGVNSLMAINALNLLAGPKGQIRFFEPPRFPSAATEPAGEEGLLKLGEEFKNKRRSLLMLYDTNPLYILPLSLGFREVFERAGFIVSFSSFLDESTEMADLILPDPTPLESWGDYVQEGILSDPTIGLGQPAVAPLYDTRPVGDLFLEAARRLGPPLSNGFPWKDFREALQERWREFLTKEKEITPVHPFEEVWIERLQAGLWRKEKGTPIPIRRQRLPEPYDPPRFDGDEKEYPFYFYPFPSMGLHDGRGANRPWLQELPDPPTTAVWGSWVEINPKTAERYHLRQGEIARVISRYGAVEAPVVYYPGNRPDLISMPMGQGHTAYGRYAKGRGVNPLLLLGPSIDRGSGVLARGATRVRIEPAGKGGRLVLVDQTGQGTKRSAKEKKGET
jgi:anaerobic selenocysteine-containing dehydrogenase